MSDRKAWRLGVVECGFVGRGFGGNAPQADRAGAALDEFLGERRVSRHLRGPQLAELHAAEVAVGSEHRAEAEAVDVAPDCVVIDELRRLAAAGLPARDLVAGNDSLLRGFLRALAEIIEHRAGGEELAELL